MHGVPNVATKVTPDERARIVEALEAGTTCHRIAKDFGRSSNTISRIAKDIGHTFAHVNALRAQEAQAAHRVYGAERRANVRLSTVEAVEETLRDFTAPTLVYSFGGKHNEYNEHILDRPDARTKRDLAQTIATLWRVVQAIDAAEETHNDITGIDKVFEIADRMGDEYDQFIQPETGVQHIEGDGQN